MKKRIATGVLFVLLTLCLSSCRLNVGWGESVEMPWWWMTVVIVLPSLLIVTLVIVLSAGHLKTITFVCPRCHVRFKPGWKAVFSPHIGDEHKLKCPCCKKRQWCSPSYEQDE